MITQFRSHWRRALVALVMLAPLLYIMALVVHYSVNVPWWDQWELYFHIKKFRDGTLTLTDLASQQNEHRLLFPRLIMLGLASVTHWNTNAETFANVVLAAGAAAMVVVLLRRSLADRLGSRLTLVLTGFVVWMMLSPAQWENWIWGWQIQWFLSILAAITTIWCIGYWPQRWSGSLRLWAAGVAAIVAMYSLANGMFIWPIGLAMLIVRREPRRRWIGWSAAGAAAIASYYVGYVNPPSQSPKTFFLHHPKSFVKYIFVYLGRPLATNIPTALVLGGALLVLFLAATAYLLIHRRQPWDGPLGWWALATYALIGAATTAVGRVALGVEQSLSSRYTTVSILFTVATVVLVVHALKIYFAETGQLDSPPTAIWFLVVPVGMIAVYEYLRDGGVTPFVIGVLPILLVLVVALVIVSSLALGRTLRWLAPVSGYRVVLGIFLAGMTLLVLNSYADGTKMMGQRHVTLLGFQKCLHEAQSADDPCLPLLYPDAKVLWPRIEYLRKIHWAGL